MSTSKAKDATEGQKFLFRKILTNYFKNKFQLMLFDPHSPTPKNNVDYDKDVLNCPAIIVCRCVALRCERQTAKKTKFTEICENIVHRACHANTPTLGDPRLKEIIQRQG